MNSEKGSQESIYNRRGPTRSVERGSPTNQVGSEEARGFHRTFGEHSGGNFSGEGPNWRYRRLDFPVFSGDNPDGWILRAERYFAFYRLTEEEKVEAAVVGLDGDALLWFQWENQRSPITRWTDLKVMLMKYFRPIEQGSLYEQWLSVTQEGSVEEYRRRFVMMAAPVEGVSEEMLRAAFIRGLEGKVKAELRVLGPKTLEEAMDWAVRVEAKINSNIGPKGRGNEFGPKGTFNEYPVVKPFLNTKPPLAKPYFPNKSHVPPQTANPCNHLLPSPNLNTQFLISGDYLTESFKKNESEGFTFDVMKNGV